MESLGGYVTMKILTNWKSDVGNCDEDMEESLSPTLSELLLNWDRKMQEAAKDLHQ